MAEHYQRKKTSPFVKFGIFILFAGLIFVIASQPQPGSLSTIAGEYSSITPSPGNHIVATSGPNFDATQYAQDRTGYQL